MGLILGSSIENRVNRPRFRHGSYRCVSMLEGLNFSDVDPTLEEQMKTPQEVNVGASIGPTSGRWRTVVALDIRDIGYNNGKKLDGTIDDSFVKRTHLGLELGYFVETKTFALLNFRAGLNQGLFTYGAETIFFWGRNLVLGYGSFSEYANSPRGQAGTEVESDSTYYYIALGI